MSTVVINKKYLIERQGKPAVLYAGLLEAAHEAGLKRITTKMLQAPSAENRWTAIWWAEVETDAGTFSGTGDANVENVTKMVAPHYIRMAETRAKARALRDALSITDVAVEELGEVEQEMRSRFDEAEVVKGTGEITSKPAKAERDLTAMVPQSDKAWQEWTALWKKARDLGHPKLPEPLKVGDTTWGELIEEGKALRAWIAEFEAKIPIPAN